MAPQTNHTTTEVLIHPFYRIWFTWIDPLILAGTVVSTVLDPDAMVAALIPPSLSTRNPLHDFLLHQLAALFAFVGVMAAVLLRCRADDVGVWRVVQGGILMVDLAMLASLWYSLGQQGRLDVRVWRGMDWGNWVITGAVTIFRTLFLLGIGNGGLRKGKSA